MSVPQALTRRVLGLSIAVFITFLAASAPAQFSGVDQTFNAVPSNPLSTPNSRSHLVQPDGKIVVFGSKNVVDGIAKGEAFRLNPDGTIDLTFSYCSRVVTSIATMMLTPDGKFMVTGTSSGAGIILRLNSNGSVDPGFLVNTPSNPFGGTNYYIQAVQPDGKVFVLGRTSAFGNVYFDLYRYNTNGTVDSGFTPMTLAAGSPVSAYVRIAILPDGRFYLAVTSGVSGTGSTLRRHNANGSVDGTFESPAFSTGFPPQVFISDLAVTADQGLVVSGRFATVNGTSKPNLVKLLSAGNVDLNFGGPNVLFGSGVKVLSDGKILFSGNIDIAGIVKLYRLTANGTVDDTFTMDPTVTGLHSGFDIDSAGRIIFFGEAAGALKLVRLLSNGTRDTTFDPKIANYGRIHAAATQSDGKVVLAGVFTEMNGTDRSSFARVNADGSSDLTFNPGTGFNLPPEKMIVQSDGKILAIGPFTEYNGTAVSGFVRINTNGSIDNGFVVTVSTEPLGIALEPDGQILISGGFSTVNGESRTGVARLNATGSLDDTFNPIVGSPFIRSVVVQGDGKILIGGSFQGVNGFNRVNLARLNADGLLDQSFTTSGVGSVNHLVLLGDGKYLLAYTNSLTRLNSNGGTDGTFTSPIFGQSGSDPYIHAVLAQPDGSILVGGNFLNVGSANRRHLARLAPNGAFDVLFLPGGTDSRVRTLVPYSSGKVIVGGEFTVINNVTKSGVARLNISTFHGKTPFDFDGDGRADYSVYRPSTGVWYQLFSNGNPYAAPVFGIAGDVPVPADYDGDGKTDVAIWRPSNGDWWYASSSTGAQVNVHFGQTGDVPMPGDFDGDGKTDFIVYRPSTRIWYRMSTSTPQQQFSFGLTGDQPVIGDFDGDGKTDMAIFRPSNGDWWYAASSAGFSHRLFHWGATGDIPAPADYDGDGKTDFAVFRPSNGGWYVYRSVDQTYTIVGFGLDGDRPIPADYDGDGRADIAVFRPSSGVWYLMQSTAGIGGVQWGLATDVAIPNAFLPEHSVMVIGISRVRRAYPFLATIGPFFFLLRVISVFSVYSVVALQARVT